MPAPRRLLYSANPFLKYYIQERYRNDVHYVWCSEYVANTSGPRSAAALIPTTSTPLDIDRDYTRFCQAPDRHHPKVREQRTGVLARAQEWFARNEIDDDARQEIVYVATEGGPEMWRPLLYVIPSAVLGSRAKLVPMADRAGLGPEYVTSDLRGSEFDVVEF